MTKSIIYPATWILLLTVSLLAVVSCNDDDNTAKDVSPNRIAILDCGSSSSKIYIFELASDGHTLTKLFPTADMAKDVNKGPALSKIENTTEAARTFITTMASKSTLTPDNLRPIPLYVLSTAGMRLVAESRADSIYHNLNSLRNSVINGLKLTTAMTISGRYEGLYAWIDANYHAGTLSDANHRVGIIEAGGASMQVAFSTSATLEPQFQQSFISHPVYGNIYSRSCFAGVDVAFRGFEDATDFPDTYNLPVENVSAIIGNTPFYYSGSRMLTYGRGLALHGSYEAYLDYAKTVTDGSYNLNFATHYIHWALNAVGIANRTTVPNFSSDWSEGAAIDILVNKRQPERYTYE